MRIHRHAKKAATAAVLAGAFALAVGLPAGAQETDPTVGLGQQLNLLWIVIGAILVIFMQAGFALVETGFCRAKHAAHVVSTNFAIFGLGFVGFFLVGFPLAFGGYSYDLPGFDWGYGAEPLGGALVGSGSWTFLFHGGWAMLGDSDRITPAVLAFFLYMVAFMDTVATIPTGSMAERWKWKSFVVWGLFCGAIYYPIFAAWTWGGGWLGKTWDTLGLGAGYADFAGSGVVHAVGGAAALAGALVLGPRIGKFGADGTPRALPGHHIPMAMLGTFILLFGWFGFNAASTFAATDVQFATVAANTAIAGAFGAVAAMLWMTYVRGGKPDPGMMANGMLAGLVAITAPCAFTRPGWSAVIGLIAGVLVIESVLVIEKRFKIDDPVGAISVHGVCGTFGVLCVGIFSDGSYGAGWNGSDVEGVKGILYGDAGQLGAQALGALVIWTVIFGLAFAFFKIQDKVASGGIRSAEEDELVGLDLPEMGVVAYPEFGGGGGLPSSASTSAPARAPETV
ncbi:ammonium transporter [Iamia sp. SCSIO 61187]|uniref:ammonium transporter n=1 Tax=Iamia sp. SCSIO 61187 TaxID=2722752 RepID=UPI001C638AB8|nr:ammonium transporter [Iamia sp. SCSIO 61187]QYG91192.1 ammonium transporter [Iamia sp. SCSIO 61187]